MTFLSSFLDLFDPDGTAVRVETPPDGRGRASVVESSGVTPLAMLERATYFEGAPVMHRFTA
ncbi:hypothetical protein [Streptomyces sp. WG-D5]